MLTMLMDTYTFTNEKDKESWHINPEGSLREFNENYPLLLESSVPLLDFLSNGKKKVTLAIATAPFEKALQLDLIQMGEAPEGGGYYQLSDHRGRVLKEHLWLCEIPLFVFGDIPEHIYLRREKRISIQHIP